MPLSQTFVPERWEDYLQCHVLEQSIFVEAKCFLEELDSERNKGRTREVKAFLAEPLWELRRSAEKGTNFCGFYFYFLFPCIS